MPPKPSNYVCLSVLTGLGIATLIMAATALRQLSSLPAPPPACECKPAEPVTGCTCDHGALLEAMSILRRDLNDWGEEIEELRGHVEATEDRLSKGESRILSEWLKAQDVIKAIKSRLDKLEGHSRSKPPVRRQTSCGAHPPSCEGIAALGADGEPDGVTGISLCAWEPGDIWRCYQEWRAKDAKERLERAKRREALRQLFMGVS